MTEYPKFNIVGEIWAESSAFIARFQKGTTFPRACETNLPTVMDFPLMTAYRDFIEDKGTLRDIYDIYALDFLYADPGNIVTFLDNHDTPRAFYIAGRNVNRVKMSLAMLLTGRGIPQLLYGTEIGMIGGKSHAELRADFPGGFDGDKRNAFTRSGRSKKENEIFDHLQTLLHLRKQHPALSIGSMTHIVPKNKVYMYLRVWNDERILVVANGNKNSRLIDLSEASHWFDGVKSLKSLLTKKMIPYQNEINIGLSGMHVGIFELKYIE